MDYISVSEFAQQHDIPARTVRHYCKTGKIEGAFIIGKTWNIPANAQLISAEGIKQLTENKLLQRLMEERAMKLKGGIYHRTQIDLTYNSNKIEGSRLTSEQTRFIFETNTIGGNTEVLNVDDIIETSNHFRCIDYIIDNALITLSEGFIKTLHAMLKTGTSDSRIDWFNVGEYKKLPNEVGGKETCPPKEVGKRMKQLLNNYNSKTAKTLDDIIDFHHQFEIIHPFQDGNGRVGRLIMFKECLANNVVSFIIEEPLKMFYYRGLQEWPRIKEYLTDTCLSAQDNYKLLLKYFEIEWAK